jgi:murein DD-endopeptidase MepM/ murein hydrolase activator NlpD
MKSLQIMALYTLIGSGIFPCRLPSADFLFPTSNRNILNPGSEDKYFVPTVGRTWPSGTFGCVRSEGFQIHEGLDIACLERDANREPRDPVSATARGIIAYVNRSTGLSNYGRYVIIAHRIEGLPVYSLYAHLSRVREDLNPGTIVTAGEEIATMGRTSNTRQKISRQRAHLHFELTFMANPNFEKWNQKRSPGSRNDHGIWHGLNLIGFDAWKLFMAQNREKNDFNLIRFIRSLTPQFRVAIKKTEFPLINYYQPLIARQDPLFPEPHEALGYEIEFDFNGLPLSIKPLHTWKSDWKSPYHLLEVDEKDFRANRCRKWVYRTGAGDWALGKNGIRHLDLISFKP